MRAFVLLLLALASASAGALTVTWAHPTTRVDGAELPLAEIAATRLEWAREGEAVRRLADRPGASDLGRRRARQSRPLVLQGLHHRPRRPDLGRDHDALRAGQRQAERTEPDLDLAVMGSTLRKTVYSPDTLAPATPSGLTATAVGQTQINLACAATSDAAAPTNAVAIGLRGYRWYVSTDNATFALLTETTSPAYIQRNSV